LLTQLGVYIGRRPTDSSVQSIYSMEEDVRRSAVVGLCCLSCVN